jgi:hypothetical protein
MALSTANICHRLQTSSTTALTLSNKFYKVLQDLPTAAFECTNFAEQFLYVSSYLEQISQALPTINPPDGAKIFEDLVKLLDLLDEAYTSSKEGLPQRTFDGAEVDILLPNEVDHLLEQIEALGVASNLISCVLVLGIKHTSNPATVTFSPSVRIAEGLVNQARQMVRTLMVSQPKDFYEGRRGIEVHATRGKAHAAITELLSQMLVQQEAVTSGKSDVEAPDAEKSSKDEENSGLHTNGTDVEKVNTVKFDRFGRDQVIVQERGRAPRHPDQVYAKIPSKDVDESTLKYYALPYTKPKV